MSYDTHDSIAAVASAAGGGSRGVVRISGVDALARLAGCFLPSDSAIALTEIARPERVRGSIQLNAPEHRSAVSIPGELLVWPTDRSYTRQPAAEFHTIGSAPLLAAIVEQLQRVGIRAAAPGEFTLRAFLAGRIDLTQAEGVLGVVDATERSDLDAALDQVAGGLSRPLHRLREELLAMLAELEAGLDFVEEDIEFVSREALAERITEAQVTVAATASQLAERDQHSKAPRVALVGAPNAGKSSLFNALVQKYGDPSAVAAIVSPTPGATRDYVVGRLTLDGVECELIDTAGVDETLRAGIEREAQLVSDRQRLDADVRVRCIEAEGRELAADGLATRGGDLIVWTKSDLQGEMPTESISPDGFHALGVSLLCSAETGAGLAELAQRLRAELGRLKAEGQSRGGSVAVTSARCAGSLRDAAAALETAATLVRSESDELLAAEIRHALDALGVIVGAICADDVLDRVFSQFCIGK